MSADIWSLGMTIFLLLNPDLRYPYENEIKDHQIDQVTFRDFMIGKFKCQQKPQMSDKYKEKRAAYWLKVLDVYEKCSEFDCKMRLDLMSKHEFDIALYEENIQPTVIDLHISQNTALEKFDLAYAKVFPTANQVLPDNDGTNCCTFLSLKISMELLNSKSLESTIYNVACDVIENYPRLVNAYRDTERFYDVMEAREICILADESMTHIKVNESTLSHYCFLSTEGLFELRRALTDMTKTEFSVAIYVCGGYTFTIVADEEMLYLIDTHPISAKSGGNNNGAIVKMNKLCVRDFHRWILERLLNSGVKGSIQTLMIIKYPQEKVMT